MEDRRNHVPFDPYHFEHSAQLGKQYGMRETFERIYYTNHWGDPASVSGEGAGEAQVQRLRRVLPSLLAELEVQTLLDLPCGDFGWMSTVPLPGIRYIGGDIVPELVARNEALYGNPSRSFVELDLTCDPLPRADLLLCRDALVHFSFHDIARALANVRASGIRYLLTTTFPAQETNEDITTGDWRPLNLEHLPFSFPPPLYLLDEGCTESRGRFQDKSLGLWQVQALSGPSLIFPETP